jgi:hypothetical protein
MMRKTLLQRPLRYGVVFLASLPLLCGGCGEKEQQAEIITLEGKVAKIDRTSDTTGKITVLYFSEKQKQDMTGTAQVTKETEIMIDGAAAILKDLRDGDHVRGEVRVDKQGGKKVQTIVKMHVDRPKSSGSGG